MADFLRILFCIGTVVLLVSLVGANHHKRPQMDHHGHHMDHKDQMDHDHDHGHCSNHSSCGECMNFHGCAWCSSGTPRCSCIKHLKEPGECEPGALLLFKNSSVIVSPKPPKGPMRPKIAKVMLRQGDKVQVVAYLKIPMDAKLKKTKKGALMKIKVKSVGPLHMMVAANCSGKFISKKKMMLCTDVEKGQTIRIKATVSLTECTDKPGIIVVKAAGLRKAKSKFIVKPLCKCEHHMMKRVRKPSRKDRVKKKKDRKDKKKKKKDRKNKKDKKGKKRRKGGKGPKKHHHSGISTCKATPDSLECSGRGRCVQGFCACQEHHKGRFCECTDHNCPRFNGELCGGPARGKCGCGVCVCRGQYFGKACEETTSTTNCMSSSRLICNGKGQCENNRCVCHQPYTGATCEDCPTCVGKCADFKPCVQCFTFLTGPLNREQCVTQCREKNLMINTFDKLDVNDPAHRVCQFKDEDDCLALFSYDTRQGPRMQTIVNVQRTKECPNRQLGKRRN